MSKYKSWDLVPPLPGREETTLANQLERWERANNMKFNELSREDWVREISAIFPMMTFEAEQFLDKMLLEELMNEPLNPITPENLRKKKASEM